MQSGEMIKDTGGDQSECVQPSPHATPKPAIEHLAYPNGQHCEIGIENKLWRRRIPGERGSGGCIERIAGGLYVWAYVKRRSTIDCSA